MNVNNNYISVNNVRRRDKNVNFCQLTPATKTLISNLIKKEYCISEKTQEINPFKLEKILKRISKDCHEEKFIPRNGIYGRKKEFTLKTGEEVLLETHNGQNNKSMVTRLYDVKDVNGNIPNPENRSYLDKFGNFTENSYQKSETHINSGNAGLQWWFSGPYNNVM